jgi:hypothetical protein
MPFQHTWGQSKRPHQSTENLFTSWQFETTHPSAEVPGPRGYPGEITRPNADWTQATGRRWLVPFGAGAGRAFDIGHQAVDANLALYYNAIRPTGSPVPKWQLSLQVTLVYPREQKPTPK